MDSVAAVLPGLLSVGISLYVAVTNHRTARAASDVQEAAAAINGYRDLCAALQVERERLVARLDKVERELAQARSVVLPLEARVAQLEAERDALLERLAVMEQGNGRGAAQGKVAAGARGTRRPR